ASIWFMRYLLRNQEVRMSMLHRPNALIVALSIVLVLSIVSCGEDDDAVDYTQVDAIITYKPLIPTTGSNILFTSTYPGVTYKGVRFVHYWMPDSTSDWHIYSDLPGAFGSSFEYSYELPGHYKMRYAVTAGSGTYAYGEVSFYVYEQYTGLFIAPSESFSRAERETQFVVGYSRPKPVNHALRWDFGDGSATEERIADSTITHYYTSPGTYNVQCILLNRDTGEAVDTAHAVANVE
ncbi:MAG: hypothetical protein CL946_05135, partial [Ectothiorhodospiraceae bacterium]|nr:hypothetical protein [Ectothiorhodospiraceae bacterium]